jgi:MoaA/NifB/PqqE/SkfB family radical SAM enzyme
LDTVGRLAPLLGRDLHLAFTISADNAAEFDGVARLAAEYGLPLSLALTHTSEHYFRPDDAAVPDEEAALRAVDAAAWYYLRRPPPGGVGRAYFAAGLRCLIRTGRRPLACRAADRFFYLDPAGDVFGCNMRAEKLGNLAEGDFDGIWEGETRAGFLPTAGSACPVQCWMVCTARTSILDHSARVGWWGLRAYGRRALGLPPPPVRADRE